MKHLIILKLVVVLLLGCTKDAKDNSFEKKPETSTSLHERNKEAREDSVELAEAYHLMSKTAAEIYPIVETEPVQSQDGEDAADDPAFWLNQDDPQQSLIFGTNKKGGIYAYSLDGSEQAYYPIGLINNVDIRNGIRLGNRNINILGGSNRSDNSVVLFEIGYNGKLSNLLENNFRIDPAFIDEVYGFCMFKDAEQKGYAIVNGKNGKIQAFQISQGDSGIQLIPYLSWDLRTQPEGMVADDENNLLYIGEEEMGIWKVGLTTNETPILVPSSRKQNNPQIEYDIEGLALYKHPSGDPTSGFLLASIQGSFTYAIFERSGDNNYIGSFKISENEDIDQVEETDGLEIHQGYVNPQFPEGLLIVQDGFNYDGDKMVNQNFKVASLEQLLSLIESQW